MPERSNPLIAVDSDQAYQYSRDTIYSNTAIRTAFDRLKNPPAEELYDLKTDPVEFHNLAGKPEFKNIQNELSTQSDACSREKENIKVYENIYTFDTMQNSGPHLTNH